MIRSVHIAAIAALAAGLLCGTGAWAKGPRDAIDGPGVPRPRFLRELFPPSLIMEHQADIGLTDRQRTEITREIADVQAKVLDVRWKLEQETSALQKLLAADRVDEADAMTRAGEVMKLEEQMKRLHLGLMIRVKNLLTPEQQKTLRALRPRARRWGSTARPPDGTP